MPTFRSGEMFRASGFIIVTANSFLTSEVKLVMGRGAALQLKRKEPGIDLEFGKKIHERCGHLGFYGLIFHRRYGLAQVKCSLDGEFMSLSIPDGSRTFKMNGERITPGISISNSEVGLASLSIAAFFLRLVCTNGMISKSEVSASYRHVSMKILQEMPQVLERVSIELGMQKEKFVISAETPVPDPLGTITSFNRQFQIGKPEQEAVEWAWPYEQGETMFHVVNTYTRAAQFQGLSAESSYKLQRVAGNVLGMLREG